MHRGTASAGHRGAFDGSEPFEADYLTGAAPMFSGAAWRALGGFDERFFMYWEDVELSIRARRKGISLWVVPTARVTHDVGGSGRGIDGVGKSVHYYYYMSRNRFLTFSASVVGRLWIAVISALSSGRMLARALRERDEASGKALAVLEGVMDGVRGRSGARRVADD